MSVSNPTYLHQFLNELNTKAKKGLSQNFLIDQNIVRKIVAALALQPEETVLEIGGGPGALTELLAKSGSPLYVIEKDTIFAQALRRFEGAHIFEGDLFDFDMDQLPEKSKIVSNLPYHLTSPILTLLLPQYRRFSTLTLMMQKEVALRLLAEPGSKMYGSLTLFTRFYADIISSFVVKGSCFYPQPKVDSMVVTFQLKKAPIDVDEEAFFTLTRTAFSQRRKMLRATLKNLGFELSVLEKAGIASTARPEELSLEQFLALYRQLN